jgi:hypothetical protein
MNSDARFLGGPFNNNFGNTGLNKATQEIFADFNILKQQVRILPVGVPTGIPRAVDAEPQPDRIYLMAH